MTVIGLRLAEPSVGTEGKCAGDKGEVASVTCSDGDITANTDRTLGDAG